jgi:hypothetical protein
MDAWDYFAWLVPVRAGTSQALTFCGPVRG